MVFFIVCGGEDFLLNILVFVLSFKYPMCMWSLEWREICTRELTILNTNLSEV